MLAVLHACEDDLKADEAMAWFRSYYQFQLGICLERHEETWLRMLVSVRDHVMRPHRDPVPYDTPPFASAQLRHTVLRARERPAHWKISRQKQPSVELVHTTQGLREPSFAQLFYLVVSHLETQNCGAASGLQSVAPSSPERQPSLGRRSLAVMPRASWL